MWLDETVSTNTVALDLAASEADPDGLVVLADYQTGGRGRQGRQWLSPRGASALCSVVVMGPENTSGHSGKLDATDLSREAGRPAGAEIAGRLNVVSAVAACEAIAEATELRPAIKWPNDLRIAGKKLGGILIESRPLGTGMNRGEASESGRRAWVMGFGINCLQHAGHFPSELAQQATSLELAASHAVDRAAVIRALLGRLDAWLGSTDWLDDSRLHAAWESLAEPIGQRIKLRLGGQDYSGYTVSVDPVGGLTVQLDNGRPMWFDPMLTSVVP